jgi:predicted nucleic acid-binding protein
MRIGTDTGFFVAFANEHARALEIWEELLNGEHTVVVSTLSIHEILVHFFRRGEATQGEEWVALLHQAENISVIPVSAEIAARSARYRHGLGLPEIDAMLLTSFLEADCDRIITTDSDFRIVHQQNILPVELLV